MSQSADAMHPLSHDYPFKTWCNYFAALGESLSTEFFGETYPKYENNRDDLKIVKRLVEKHEQDPQDGLDSLLSIITGEGSRYSKDFFIYGDLTEIIEYLMSKGAKLNEYYLYSSNFDEMADEIQSYEMRGYLIDDLAKKGIITVESAKEYTDWSKIEPCDEEIDYEMNEMDDPEEFEAQRLYELKSQSKFLSNIK
jgi:hypothetical protein